AWRARSQDGARAASTERRATESGPPETAARTRSPGLSNPLARAVAATRPASCDRAVCGCTDWLMTTTSSCVGQALGHSLECFPGPVHGLVDVSGQLLRPSEREIAAQPLDELDANVLSVQGHVLIQQVHLQKPLTGTEGRARAEVGHRVEVALVPDDRGGIHAVGGDDAAPGKAKVGGRPAQGLTAALPLHDWTRARVQTAAAPRGSAHVPGLHELADRA